MVGNFVLTTRQIVFLFSRNDKVSRACHLVTHRWFKIFVTFFVLYSKDFRNLVEFVVKFVIANKLKLRPYDKTFVF